MNHFPVNWFDFTVIVVLLIGLARGRKNGLSQELLVMLQWLAMVGVAGLLYRPAGQFMTQNTVFSLLFCYIISYLCIAVIVKILFSLIKRGLGGKLIGSDVFGGWEYYLGMIAGLLRFACILIIVLSFLGARFYSTAELKAKAKYDADVYGSSYWPTLSSVQIDVFQNSFSGPHIKNFLAPVLIEPTAPDTKQIQRKEAGVL